jgi:transposase InsO family protein
MLWELSVAEQRYRAVLEAGAGVPVTEVAERYGVSRQSVHTWLVRYRQEGIAGLEDRSHQVRSHPWRIPAEVEQAICEMRRAHPAWGPRRLVFEMDRRGYGTVTRSSVYRTLVRNGLVEPRSRRRRRQDYRRWERGSPMELWQLDVTASAFLASGPEVKIVTGVDDHSRFCVLATAVMRATARPVCLAFIGAMRAYGVPEEVLTDNGKVFTGRFHKPGVPVEVLFDRICRDNGITHRLTKIHSPTTTGKIERLHQTLQRELLDVHGPFAGLEALQAALDGWREEYNTDRPHQSLAMGFPASRFSPTVSALQLRIPAQLTASAEQPTPAQPDPDLPPAPRLPAGASQPVAVTSQGRAAVEVDRVVPPSGNLQVGGQQVWLSPALAGRQVTIWVDETRLHILLDGTRVKTLPSRLGITELARLAAHGGRPASPSPLPTGKTAVIEVDRTVNAAGIVCLAQQQVSVGLPLAGQRVTLRMEGPLMAVLGHDQTLLRTLACPIPPGSRPRLRGARRARSLPPAPGGQVTVWRRVSCRGAFMVARQKIHAGMIHAGKTATVICDNNHFRVVIDGETAAVVPRTTTSEIHRYKANATDKRTLTRLTRQGQ